MHAYSTFIRSANVKHVFHLLLQNNPHTHTSEFTAQEITKYSNMSQLIMSPQPKGGHIVFGADPVGVSVGVCVCVRVASFPQVIF